MRRVHRPRPTGPSFSLHFAISDSPPVLPKKDFEFALAPAGVKSPAHRTRAAQPLAVVSRHDSWCPPFRSRDWLTLKHKPTIYTLLAAVQTGNPTRNATRKKAIRWFQ